MKVLFVGGTGNISASCARLCVERGMEVFLLNRGRRPVVIDGARTLLGDARDPAQLQAAVGTLRFDAVAQFVGYTPQDVERDHAFFAGRTRQYLFVSSTAAYQKPLPCPATESTPLKNPFWEYARQKIACEERLNALWRERDFPVVIVRPSLTYASLWPIAIGARDDMTLVSRMRRGGEVIVHGDGSSLWTLTHAEDFARGFVGLLGNGAAVGHAFHITSDEVLTWDRIYTTIAEAAGVEEPKLVHVPSEFLARLSERWSGTLLGDKAHSAVFDNTKIRRFVPGFACSIPFHLGARRTLEWFLADPARQRTDPASDAQMDAALAAWRRAQAAARTE